MRKYIDKKHIFTPLPVLLLGTYDENGIPNAMNAAWGGQIDANEIIVSLSQHKTTDNLQLKQAFTISFADRKHTAEADYLGMASGKKINKIEKAGLHAMKAEKVDAPVFEEFPLALECEVERLEPDGTGFLRFDHRLQRVKLITVAAGGTFQLTALRAIRKRRAAAGTLIRNCTHIQPFFRSLFLFIPNQISTKGLSAKPRTHRLNKPVG